MQIHSRPVTKYVSHRCCSKTQQITYIFR